MSSPDCSLSFRVEDRVPTTSPVSNLISVIRTWKNKRSQEWRSRIRGGRGAENVPSPSIILGEYLHIGSRSKCPKQGIKVLPCTTNQTLLKSAKGAREHRGNFQVSVYTRARLRAWSPWTVSSFLLLSQCGSGIRILPECSWHSYQAEGLMLSSRHSKELGQEKLRGTEKVHSGNVKLFFCGLPCCLPRTVRDPRPHSRSSGSTCLIEGKQRALGWGHALPLSCSSL